MHMPMTLFSMWYHAQLIQAITALSTVEAQCNMVQFTIFNVGKNMFPYKKL